MRVILFAALWLGATAAGAAPAAVPAWGRHWQVTVEKIECSVAESSITLGTRVRYLGPAGPVEEPANQLVDDQGRAHAPRTLVWQSGSKLLAAWLSKGGLANLGANETAQLQFRYRMRENAAGLKLEFGDIPAFAIGRAGKDLCKSLLRPSQIQAPRRPKAAGGKATLRFYREAYPCEPPSGGEWRRVEAPHPPYLPEQLLVFGRGHLPAARTIELPMGKAAAQSYAYSGAEELPAIEDAARRALAEDFPALRSSPRYFAFNWGLQRASSGNELYSVGVYPIRPCGR